MKPLRTGALCGALLLASACLAVACTEDRSPPTGGITSSASGESSSGVSGSGKGGGSAQGGRGGVGGTAATGGGGQGGVGGGASCQSCNSWLSGCFGDAIQGPGECSQTAEVCAGTSVILASAVQSCLCSSCAVECDFSCSGLGINVASCAQCLATSGCAVDTCVNDL